MDLEHIKKTIEDIGTGLDPDEDWLPVLVLRKSGNIEVIGLCDSMHNQETKDATAKFMTESIAETCPDSAIFVSTAWCVQIKQTGKYEGPRPSEHPDRQEVVSVVCMDKESDTVLIGKILRLPGAHPEIIEWEEMKCNVSGGRFSEAMREGFNQYQFNQYKKKGAQWRQ